MLRTTTFAAVLKYKRRVAFDAQQQLARQQKPLKVLPSDQDHLPRIQSYLGARLAFHFEDVLCKAEVSCRVSATNKLPAPC